MHGHWKKYNLKFKQPAGTSRGVLKTKDSYFIVLENEGKQGVGECGLLRGLSADDRGDYEVTLNWLMEHLDLREAELFGRLVEFPSIQFGLEMALRDLESKNHQLFPSDFTAGKAKQPINGLIWMGEADRMHKQVKERLKEGFGVLKMKIGAINVEEELGILRSIRQQYHSKELELRVDANGAFKPEEAMEVLKRLADLEVHSIEQPIKKGQWEEMARICENPPIPIALDEELIGLFSLADRQKMLQTIHPQYIILKPSFIGGWRGSDEWKELARDYQCGWWVTSALESNIGLNAIAQWNYLQDNPIPSGLGTGSLYTNNFESPLLITSGKIAYDPTHAWDLSKLLG